MLGTAKAIAQKFPTLPKSIIKNFFVYAGGGVILKLFSFLSLPFLLGHLSTHEYGQLSLIMTATTIISTIAGLGLRQMLSLEYFHYAEPDRLRLIQEMVSIYCFLGLPLIALGCACALAGHILPLPLLGLVSIYCALSFFSELTYQLLQYRMQAVGSAALQCASAVIALCIQYNCVVRGHTLAGILAGLAVGALLPTLIIAPYFNVQIPNVVTIKNYLTKSVPFIPGILCAWVIAVGDRWLLAMYSSLDDVGIYAIADCVSTIFQMLILVPLGGAYVTYALNQYAQNRENLLEIERWNRRLMVASMLGLSAATIGGFVLMRPLLLQLLPAHYHAAVQYMPSIALGNILLMGTYFASCIIQFHKKTYFLAIAWCVPAVLNVVLNSALIQFFGIWGCVGGTILAYASYFGLIVWYNRFLTNKILTRREGSLKIGIRTSNIQGINNESNPIT